MPITAALIGGGASLLGGMMAGGSAADASREQAAAQERIAKQAAEEARFRPIGITSNYGSSNFGFDPTTGRLNSAGYNLNPQLQGQQQQLMGMLGGGLDQYQQGQQVNQGVLNSAQTMFGLGQGYLQKSPQEQAAQYMQQQQALLQPSRQREDAAMQQHLFNTGRGGLSVGATDTLHGTNPEQEAMYNARMMQDLNLASQATQGGMDYAKFGAGMMGTGSNTLRDYYQNQSAAAAPWQTTMGLSNQLEGLGKDAMTTGMSLGNSQAAAGAVSGGMLQSGMNAAAANRAQANSYNPFASALMAGGQALQGYQMPQTMFSNNQRQADLNNAQGASTSWW